MAFYTENEKQAFQTQFSEIAKKEIKLNFYAGNIVGLTDELSMYRITEYMGADEFFKYFKYGYSKIFNSYFVALQDPDT